MINKVRTFITREIGLPAEARVLVGLSGGADSTALLIILKELGYRLRALHCNFHLRGEESDRDQTFVEQLCREQDVPLDVRHFNTEEVAKERGISIEMAARDLRYDWFREERVKSEESRKNSQLSTLNSQLPTFISSTFHADAPRCVPTNFQLPTFVAVAHHRDDQAETLLLNLLRGTGLRGLAGMQAKHEGIIRPLLCLSRGEITDFLESRGQSYVTDSTNLERIAQRNRIRLDLIPLLQSLNPLAVEHLLLASDNIRESLPYYLKGLEAARKELGIMAERFPLSALSSRTLLHEWLRGKGFNRAQEEEMLRSDGIQSGKMWQSKTHLVLLDRQALLMKSANQQTEVPQIRQEIVPCIGETGADVAYFDADLLTAPIVVRRVREGDAFVPFGMKGRKLVSDFLTDRKLSRLEKQQQFVCVCGNDIIWLIGHRSDNRYRVTAQTSRILKLSVHAPKTIHE